jgi:hypothetical protein
MFEERDLRQAGEEIAPFTPPFIKLDEVDSAEMEAVIENRIEGRFWRERTRAEAGLVKYMSRVFIARDSDGKARAVADLSHLFDHYGGVITKSEGLEGFAASMLQEDTMISMDLKSGYHQMRLHPYMRQYFSISVMTADGMDGEVLHVFRAEPEWFLVCPNCHSILDVCQESLGVPRAVVHR